MNKSILITGSSHGIGAGIAKHFGTLKYTVFITYLKDKSAAEEVAEEVGKSGGKAVVSPLDVTDESSVQALFEKIKKANTHLDVLVNNAAVDWATPIDTASFDDWKKITRTKLDGVFLCTKYALPLLKKSSNPNVLFIGSNLGVKPDPEDPAYSAATAGLMSFAESMALALPKHKIRANTVCASATRTNMKFWKDIGGDDALWTKLAKENPLGRVGTPKDIALMIDRIVHDQGKFINGATIYVTGGSHLK